MERLTIMGQSMSIPQVVKNFIPIAFLQ